MLLITIDRPERMNATDERLHHELAYRDALSEPYDLPQGMEARAQAEKSASATGGAVDRAHTRVQRARRSLAGRWWVALGAVVVALAKGHALAGLVHHRGDVIVACSVGLVVSLLRSRPVAVALFAGPLLAFALAPRSTAVGVAVGFGTFALLLAMFLAIATLLRARVLGARDRRHGLEGSARQPSSRSTRSAVSETPASHLATARMPQHGPRRIPD